MNTGKENKGEKTDQQETLENKGENQEPKKPRKRRIISHQGVLTNTQASDFNWWHMLAR